MACCAVAGTCRHGRRGFTGRARARHPVDKLPLPFRSVASDLLTGELVELRSTPLFMSIRASLAVPGVFSPLRLDGRLVVDGGLVRNLPVDIARAMGAEVIIAVNVGTPLAKESEITSAVDVAQQMLSILTEQNVQRSIKELGPDDVLIAPDLAGVTFLDFSQSQAAIAAGEAAVRASAAQLRRLSVSAAEYERYQLARTLAPNALATAPPLDKVSVEATPPEISVALAAQTGLRNAGTVTLGQVSRAASQLFGGGDFDRVYVDVREVDGRREAVLHATEAEWARSRLRLGVEMISDFADDNRFTVSALHVMPWLNNWGAELRSLVRVGSDRSIGTQLQQPLAPGSPWHITPAIRYDASSADLYSDGRRIARVGYRYATTVLGVGRELSNWGNVQLGAIQRAGRVKFLIAPDNASGDGHFTQRAYFAEMQTDTVDSLAFPTRGLFFNAHWEWDMGASSDDSTDEPQRRSAVVAMQAFQLGDWAGHVYGEWAKSRRSVAPSQLGGFMRLSGTERGSVDGNTVVLGRVVMARRIGLMPPGMGGAVRAGLSLELGTGVDALQSVHFGDLRQAGSAFVAVDTRFGPLFFALGSTRNGSSAVYLFLGPYW